LTDVQTDIVDIMSWRRNAPIGEDYTYFTGMLCSAREKDPAIHKVGDEAWNLASRGRVCLIQRKIDAGNYAYVAVASDLAPWPVKL
jgi:hypothetical protein